MFFIRCVPRYLMLFVAIVDIFFLFHIVLVIMYRNGSFYI